MNYLETGSQTRGLTEDPFNTFKTAYGTFKETEIIMLYSFNEKSRNRENSHTWTIEIILAVPVLFPDFYFALFCCIFTIV